jgi:hypothetical protein
MEFITLPGTYSLSKNPVVFVIDVPEYASEENVRVLFEVTIATKTYQLEAPVDNSERVRFDISYLLHRVMQQFKTDIVSTSILVSTDASCIKPYSVKASLIKGIIPEVDPTNTIEAIQLYVVNGGVNLQLLPRLDFFGSLAIFNTFLSNYPSVKKVFMDQPEVLYIFNASLELELTQLEVKLYKKTTGSLFTEFMAYSYAWEAGTIYTYNVSPGALNLQSYADDAGFELLYYTVQVKSGAGAELSEVFTFYIDYSNTIEKTHIRFRNSKGGFDSLTFKGEVVEKSNIDKTSANVYLDQSVVDAYTSVKSSSIITSASERISKTVSTGFISNAELSILRDLFVSEEVYEMVNGYYYPVEIVGKSFERRSEDELKKYSIEFRNQFTSNVYQSY